MPLSSQEDQCRPRGGIDVTALVDVVLLLLIIFVVTAPLLERRLEAHSPAEAAASSQQHPVLVSVRADGTVWLDSRIVDEARLSAGVGALMVPAATRREPR